MQLVELSETIDPGVAVVAVSYDPAEVLARFAERHRIGYPLLSDEGSRVITALGLLNEEAPADAAYWGRQPAPRHRGLPYPGTFVLDTDGVVVDKRFERSHRNRYTGRVLTAPLGARPGADPELEATAHGPGVSVRVTADRRRVFPNQIFVIDVAVAVAPDLHLYVPPVPDGYRPLDVSVAAPPGVYWDPPALPEGEPFSIPGLGESFFVVEGQVDLQIPVHIHEDAGDVVPITVAVDTQACDAVACLPPDTVTVDLTFEVRPKM